jgi:hypothetical protein
MSSRGSQTISRRNRQAPFPVNSTGLPVYTCSANRVFMKINVLASWPPVFRLFFYGRIPPLPMKEAAGFSVCRDPAKPLSPAP